MGAIVRHIENSLHEGCREFWLTSQDNGCYGYDIESNIAELLNALVDVQGDFKVRVGMMNPQYIEDYLPELIRAYRSEKIFKFLHIPVQAGSDTVLKDMKREYDTETFKRVVKKLRDNFPEMTLSTDIICGFPTETREDFEKTIYLVQEVRPSIINISRFWPRPGTVAAHLKLLPGEETKKRSTELKNIFDKIALRENQKWVGWKGEVLIDEQGKNNTWIGRNFAYMQVILHGHHTLGETATVRIDRATRYDLRAHIVC